MESISDYVASSCQHVLETMFFTVVLGVDEVNEAAAAPEGDPSFIATAIQFAGPPDGRLRLAMPAETAASLACSFLGRSREEVDPSDVLGVSGELANMICGAVLSRYAPASEFRLSTPQVSLPSYCQQRPAELYRAALLLPEGSLRVCMQVDRASAA